MINEDRKNPLGTYVKFLEALLELQGKPHSYDEAGINAPESVKHAIREYHALPDEVKENTPLLYYILGSGTPPYKMTQEDSEYTDQATDSTMNCANCEFAYMKVITSKYICSQIRDEIKPEGWCNQWKSGNEDK